MEDPAPVSPLHQELAALRHRVTDLEAALTVQQHDAQALGGRVVGGDRPGRLGHRGGAEPAPCRQGAREQKGQAHGRHPLLRMGGCRPCQDSAAATDGRGAMYPSAFVCG